ncbi:MAG TPA: hypothetical protein VHJ34_13110 [Actinomycetota bacterium]|nr:hypothetical protein [Actinomycetota bacterium]
MHDLRHTAVALAIKVGAHPKEIQARAGHSSIQVTMDRYGHLFEGQDVALAERLDMLRQLHQDMAQANLNPPPTHPQVSQGSEIEGSGWQHTDERKTA